MRFKLDKSKKTIQAILQYSRSFEDFKDHLSNMIDTEEQWELDIAFIYSKFFVTCYNSPIGLNSPIYLKHIRAHKDDEMLESINMNNCHEFLDSFIKLALSMSDYESDNKWIVNIGKKLRSTFRKYKNKLNDVAYVFYNYIRYSSVDNVLKVLSFLGLPKREGQKILKNMTHTKLYFDCVGRFIVTGATPIKNSTLPLSKIKPPAFLEEQIRLPDFSALCTTYVGSNADCMLSAFFTAHLLMEFASSQNKYLTVEMLEELRVDCSAKELKGVDDEFNDSEVLEYNKFRMLENVQHEFSVSMRERGQNFSDGRDASNESQTISNRSQIIYQDIKYITQDLKNILSKTESISNKSKDVFQNIQNSKHTIRN